MGIDKVGQQPQPTIQPQGDDRHNAVAANKAKSQKKAEQAEAEQKQINDKSAATQEKAGDTALAAGSMCGPWGMLVGGVIKGATTVSAGITRKNSAANIAVNTASAGIAAKSKQKPSAPAAATAEATAAVPPKTATPSKVG